MNDRLACFWKLRGALLLLPLFSWITFLGLGLFWREMGTFRPFRGLVGDGLVALIAAPSADCSKENLTSFSAWLPLE